MQRSKKLAQETLSAATVEVVADDCVLSEKNNEVAPPTGRTSLSNEQWVRLPVWQRKILRENMVKQAHSESTVRNDVKPAVPHEDEVRLAEHIDGSNNVFSVIGMVRIFFSCNGFSV